MSALWRKGFFILFPTEKSVLHLLRNIIPSPRLQIGCMTCSSTLPRLCLYLCRLCSGGPHGLFRTGDRVHCSLADRNLLGPHNGHSWYIPLYIEDVGYMICSSSTYLYWEYMTSTTVGKKYNSEIFWKSSACRNDSRNTLLWSKWQNNFYKLFKLFRGEKSYAKHGFIYSFCPNSICIFNT